MSRSQPSGRSATGTGRAPIARTASTAVEARVVDEDAVPRSDQDAQEQGERVLRPRRDQHLLESGRDAAAGEVRGDGGAEHGKAERVVAGAGQVTRELGHGGGQGPVQGRLGRRRRTPG